MRLVALALVIAACGNDRATELRIERSTPEFGLLVGGTQIALTGTGFASDSAPSRVLIGGREAPVVTAIDDATLEVVIPPGDRFGDAEVVVFNGNGNASATGMFRYSAPPTIAAIAPADVVFSSTTTRVTLTGSGFLDESAGTVNVVVGGKVAADVVVESDGVVTFAAPSGRALSRPDIELVDARGTATRARGFRYTPGPRPGLLLFPPSNSTFAVFFDPTDNSSVAIPWIATALRFTAVVRDDHGDYWAVDRNRRIGRLDLAAQTLDNPVATQGTFPAVVRVGADYFAIDRNTLRFGKVDPATGGFASVGDVALPCCGSYGLASDGTTIWFTAREAGQIKINTIDGASGAVGPPVTIAVTAGFHVEDMRLFEGKLYASSRDGRLVTIDPTTGVATALPVSLGRFNAMEVFE